jgi:hypothetical protein
MGLIEDALEGQPVADIIQLAVEGSIPEKTIPETIRALNATLRQHGISYSKFVGHPYIKTIFEGSSRRSKIESLSYLAHFAPKVLSSLIQEVKARV